VEFAEVLKKAQKVIEDNQPTTVIGILQYPMAGWVVRFVIKNEGGEALIKEVSI